MGIEEFEKTGLLTARADFGEVLVLYRHTVSRLVSAMKGVPFLRSRRHVRLLKPLRADLSSD